MRRLLTATLVALLVVGLLPVSAFAAVPTVVGLTPSTAEDTEVTITLSASDEDGDATTAFTPVTPTNGTLDPVGAIQCDGGTPNVCTADVVYHPTSDFNGSDSFTYTATANAEESDAGSVSITVTPVNDPPSFTVGEDQLVLEDAGAQSVPGFIADGSTGPDDEGQTIAYTLEAAEDALFSVQPAVSESGTLTYTPLANASGTTSVTISASDGQAATTAQQFDITITPVNDPPAFTKGDDVQVAKGAPAVSLPGWATGITSGPGESDEVSFAVVASDDTVFTVQPTVSGTGTLTFTPAATAGSTTVSVTAVDDGTPPAQSAGQTFTITINDGPAANAQVVNVTEDSSANVITLTGSDPEDDALDYTVVTQPAHGTLSGTAPDLTYTPDANYFGDDGFTFKVDDNVTESPAATVTIDVSPVDDVVDARSDAVTINPTITTTLDLFKVNGGGADSAGPGESLGDLVITAVTKPAKGSISITDNGTRVKYDPIRCAYGSDTFTYTISDGQSTDTATVVVTIRRPGEGGLSSNPVTDTPVIAFVTNSTEAATMPMKLAWCAVTASGSSASTYRMDRSTNAGSTYTKLLDGTRTASDTRSLSFGTSYRWRARTKDSLNRTGAFAYSIVSRLGRIQNNSVGITYAGAWSTLTTSAASGGTMRSTTSKGASASVTLTNVRTFALTGARSNTRGSFRVYVDNVLVATVSAKTSSSTILYRRVLYQRNVTFGVGVSHVIRVEAVGNGRVDLDTILTLATP